MRKKDSFFPIEFENMKNSNTKIADFQAIIPLFMSKARKYAKLIANWKR